MTLRATYTNRRYINLSERATKLIIHVALIVLAAVTLLPLIWLALTSFKTNGEIMRIPPTVIPEEWQGQNYSDAWQSQPFARIMLNSVIFAAGSALMATVTSAGAGYAFARFTFPFKGAIFAIFLVALMIPDQVTLIPNFIITKNLGWLDTYQGLIAPYAFSAFGIFLLRQFFLQIPSELEDSALVDGAGRIRAFFHVMLPLAGPALATVFVITFVGQWNNLLWPLVVSSTSQTTTVALGLLNFQGQFGSSWNLLSAAAVLITLPVLVIYIFAQRWFVAGIAMTGFGGR
jgi:multiple sugar transport system permease protein